MTLVALAVSILGSLPGADLYLDGHDALVEGRYGDAYKAFQVCASTEGPLQSYAYVQATVCMAAAGQQDTAISLLEAFLRSVTTGPWVRMAQAELGELYAARNQYRDAASWFEKALTTSFTSWFLESYQWKAADNWLNVEGSADKGFAFFREVVSDPGFRVRRFEAAERLARSTSPEDLWLAAGQMIRGDSYNTAEKPLNALRAAALADSGLWPRWQVLQGRALVGQGKREEGRELLRQVAQTLPGTDAGRMALAYLARSLQSEKGGAEADAAFDQLVTQYPGGKETGDALWWRAERWASEGKFDQAIREYLRLADVCPNHERADDALLAAGHVQRAQNRLSDAVASYQAVVTRHAESRLAPEAAYWSGRVKESILDKQGAIVDYCMAVDRGFGNYYGHRAGERLVAMGDRSHPDAKRVNVGGVNFAIWAYPQEHHQNRVSPEERGGPTRDALERLSFFGRNGLPEGEWEALFLAASAAEATDAVRLALALADAGLAHTANQLLDARKLGYEDGLPTPARLAVMYPRPYWEDATHVAAEAGVDPLLLMAIARQESTFRPAISSSAGAVGVMQLMPATAGWMVGADEAIQAEHAANLTRPANSLRLGAFYLRRMLERTGGDVAQALAAYNAGPGNLRKWQRERPKDDTEAFIERIPFSETRNYVKRVLGNYGAYKSLYDLAGPGR